MKKLICFLLSLCLMLGALALAEEGKTVTINANNAEREPAQIVVP